MNLVPRYAYHRMQKITRADGVRHYIDPVTGQWLPSVTTVLDATADKQWLIDWIKSVGKRKAEEIRLEALALGGEMHSYLDHYATGQPRPRGNYLLRAKANRMADAIIDQGLSHVGEIWGAEVMLHASGVYAGTTDLIGLYDGVPAVIDYKTARTLKDPASETMLDYFAQAAAYSLAHNFTFDTKIRMCVILMVDHTGTVVTFKLEGAAFERAIARWEHRVLAYLRLATVKKICANANSVFDNRILA